MHTILLIVQRRTAALVAATAACGSKSVVQKILQARTKADQKGPEELWYRAWLGIGHCFNKGEGEEVTPRVFFVAVEKPLATALLFISCLGGRDLSAKQIICI